MSIGSHAYSVSKVVHPHKLFILGGLYTVPQGHFLHSIPLGFDQTGESAIFTVVLGPDTIRNRERKTWQPPNLLSAPVYSIINLTNPSFLPSFLLRQCHLPLSVTGMLSEYSSYTKVSCPSQISKQKNSPGYYHLFQSMHQKCMRPGVISRHH